MQIKVAFPNINIPRVDPATGLPTPEWYRFDETMFKRTGGATGDRTAGVEVRLTQAEDDITAIEAAQPTYALKSLTVTFGNGMVGTTHDLSSGFTLAALKQTGWTAGTGTVNKGAFATYAGQTVSAGYVQAEAQATDDAVKALSQRVLALEAALRANGGIN